MAALRMVAALLVTQILSSPCNDSFETQSTFLVPDVYQPEFCSPWSYVISDKEKCQCGQIPEDFILCQSGKSFIKDRYCVTYNGEGIVQLGSCIYNWISSNNQSIIESFYYPLPDNVSKLNEAICEPFNRQNTLCGQCKDDHYPLAYSFNMTCVQYHQGNIDWLKYVCAAFLPLTLFYFIILLFKVSIASSNLHGFVLYSQAISIPASSRILILGSQNRREYVGMVKIIIALYGIWNLDFFRPFNLGFCLGTGSLLTLALDLLVAVYPLLLIVLSYLLITLYGYNFRPLVVIWRPFHSIFSLFRKNWDIRTSLIDSFATFLLLSNFKFLSVAYDLLLPVQVYQLSSSGNFSYSWRVYYDPTISYFGSDHLPYAILAIAVLSVFVLLPILLLLLYPLGCVQKMLNIFPVRWYILHTFMDSFQGCYKDGTEAGTRDCRWFAALFLLARVFILLLSVFTTGTTYFVIAPFVISTISLLLVTIRPFKNRVGYYSDSNALFVLLIALLHISVVGIDITVMKKHEMEKFFYSFSAVVACLPLLYIVVIILHWLFRHRKFAIEFVRWWQVKRRGYKVLDN